MEKERASIAELDGMLGKIIGGSEEKVPLAQRLHAKALSEIRWKSLRHLRIIGDADPECLGGFEGNGLGRGAYCKEDGSWLLVILPQDLEPGSCLRRCGPALESLSVENCYSPAGQLRLGHLTGLTALRLSACIGFEEIQGLGKLTRLTGLEIWKWGSLSTLPGLEKLTRLTRLDIWQCNSLSALPDLGSLTQLTVLRISRCSSLTALPGLEKLTRLTALDLSWFIGLPALPGLGTLTQLTALDLTRCIKLTALPGLEKLTQLAELRLSHCTKLTTLPGLERLTGLTALDLSSCIGLTALPGLGNLTQLTALKLEADKKLTALPGLEKLVQLTHLELSGCMRITALPGLEKLVQLTRLDLSRCLRLAQLPSLDKLVQLTELDLSGCMELTALPGLEKLVQLTRLELSGCEQLTALPGLENLVQLPRLDLTGCEQLTKLPSLEKLGQLTRLQLSNCRELTELSGLEKLEHLTRLSLFGCGQISVLPESIRQLKALRELDLRFMHLQQLPDWLPEIAEGFSFDGIISDQGQKKAIIYLRGTTVDDIPDMSIFEQPYEMVAEWFKSRRMGAVRPLNEIKVVFLGDGEAGKSHTIARLMNDGGDPVGYVDASTPGIVIKDREYTADGRTFRVHYWDFGGQEIMHSMHRIFLTGRTMYVVLLNARDDTQGERAKYWLHNVRSFAPDAPVLLVLNKIDQNPNASVDEKDLRSRCGKLTQVVRLSARDFSRDDFNTCFTNVLLEEIRKTGYLDAQWPAAWTTVKEQLEHMTSHYIMGDEYQQICEECRVDQNQKELLHWFNDLGVSFCYCDDYRLEEYVILRPDWITNALYIILFNSLEGARNGLIPHSSIYALLKNACRDPRIRCTLPRARYTTFDIGYVLGVMRKFSLSFTDGHDNEFIPMLCQQDSMIDIRHDHRDPEVLEFRMEFDYLPSNLLHRLMVERYRELDMTTVWRTGARFEARELGYQAVAVIDGNDLCLFIRHSDPMHRPNTYLTMLKAHVDRLVADMGLRPPACRLIYKLDGKQEEFEYALMTEMMDAGETTVYSRIRRARIPIMDILNQSAPDGLEDEQRLLAAIKTSCLHILAEPDYHLKVGDNGRGLEDKRNRRIRDDLQLLGYDVKDQTQRGLSGTGRGVGELDLLLYNDRKEPWTILEALRVSSGTKHEWDRHLDKLLDSYNYFGAPCVFLLTYVDADAPAFQRIWDGYQQHIPGIDPGKFTYRKNSLVLPKDAGGPGYVKTAVCRYDCGNQMTTAYHIFVRIPRRDG